MSSKRGRESCSIGARFGAGAGPALLKFRSRKDSGRWQNQLREKIMAPVHEEGLKGECEGFPRISDIEHEFFVVISNEEGWKDLLQFDAERRGMPVHAG